MRCPPHPDIVPVPEPVPVPAPIPVPVPVPVPVPLPLPLPLPGAQLMQVVAVPGAPHGVCP